MSITLVFAGPQVDGAVLQSIAISFRPTALVFYSQQFTVTGTYDTGNQIIHDSVAWSLSDTSVASVTSGPDAGVMTAAAGGQVYGGTVGLTASFGGKTDASSVTVIPTDSGTVGLFPRMPLRNSDWTALGLSPWGAFGGCQEATGSLVLSGSAGYTLTPNNVAANNPVAYGAVIPGWTRVGVNVSGTNGLRFSAAAGIGPNPSTDSMALLGYITVAPGTTVSQVFGLGAAAAASRLIFTCDSSNGFTGQVDFSFNANVRKLVGPSNMRHATRVHPFLMVYNRTTAETWAFTDECLTMSGSAPAQADGTKMLGANNNVAASASMVYYASCTGSVAESFSNKDSAAALLTALGWNVAYSGVLADSGTIRRPITPACWRSIGLSPWAAVHPCQEVTGNLATFDVWPGTQVNGWNLQPSLNVTYRNQLAGWNSRFVALPEVTSSRVNIANNLVGSYTGSVAFMAYAQSFTPSGSARSLMGGWTTALGGQFRIQFGTDGRPQLNCSGTATTAVNGHCDGRVHPYLIVYSVANSRAKMYTDLEAVTGTFGTLNQTPSLGLGALAVGQIPMAASYNFFASATGTVADTLSDDGQASLFLKTLGWTVPW